MVVSRWASSTEKEKPPIVPRLSGMLKDQHMILRELRGYAWIPAWQKTKALQAELQDLTREKKDIQARPPAKADLLKFAKERYAAHIAEVKKKAVDNLLHGNPKGDPFENIAAGPAWEIVESAVKGLKDPPAAITSAARAKRLEEVKFRLESVGIELLEIYPKNSFWRNNSFTGADIRDGFVKYWVEKQKLVDAPCGPSGRALEHSSKAEQKAYKTLEIRQFVNKNAQFRPAGR